MATNQDKFYDILFDNSRSIVESNKEIPHVRHTTSLIEDGKVVAQRITTSAGTTFNILEG